MNDIYGTYARGWDGEGEYGDGDKVYVSNLNPEYQSYDYVETDLDNRVSRGPKTIVASWHCHPESFCASGKFLRVRKVFARINEKTF